MNKTKRQKIGKEIDMGLDENTIKCFVECKQEALADWLDCEIDDIKYLGNYSSINNSRFLYNEEEYLVLTEDEAEEYAEKLAEEILHELVKSVNESIIYNYFDTKRWIKDYVKNTGRGPIISDCEGVEWIVYLDKDTQEYTGQQYYCVYKM